MALLDPTRTIRLADRMRWLSARTTARVWVVIHQFGPHHWQDGYEEDLERGWRRYRGLRCTVCDEPWEGW
jgi:hypothetical protein